MKKIISTDKAPAAIGPYSQAVEVNGLVFTSGVIPIIPETGELVEGGIEKQAEQAIGNLKALIEASGAKIEDTIKTVVFIKDMNDFLKLDGKCCTTHGNHPLDLCGIDHGHDAWNDRSLNVGNPASLLKAKERMIVKT